MNEIKVILNDLRKYLKERGVETKVWFVFNMWMMSLVVENRPIGFHYSIIDGFVSIPEYFHSSVFNGKYIVSLADPQYKEKFYEYLEGKWLKG